MRKLRQRIGEATGADVVNGKNGIVRAERPAAIDDFLRAALDFGVAPLHGIEVEIFLVRPRAHAGGCSAAHADQHAGTAELNHQCARRHFALERVRRRDVADTAGNHDRLVITAHLARHFFLERAEVTG